MNHLTETWQIHNRVNLYLLDSIDESYLKNVSASKGRNVGEQFAHMHNVRLMWLKVADPVLVDGSTKIEKETITKVILMDELKISGTAIENLLDKAFAGGLIKGFKPHAAAFLVYHISHQSHHRGQVMLSLKQSGHPVNKTVQFGIWDWGTR